MPVFNNILAGAAGAGGAAGYKIERSLRFNDSNSAHLSRTFSAGNSQKWTWAAWVKRNKLGGYQTLFGHVSGTSGQHYIDFGSDKIRFTRYVSSNEAALETEAVYRDVSAWMHVCAIWDVGNSTANHRQRLFVNGLEVTEFSTRTNPSQNYTGGVISTAIEHHIGKVLSQNYGAFQLADVHFLDGIVAGIATDDASGSVTGTPNAAYLTDFGEFDATTGVWNPIEYTGSYTSTGSTSGTLLNYNSNTSLPTYSNQDGGSSTPSALANAFDGNSSTYANMTYLNGKWTRANFAQPITNVTRIDIGWDGEGDVGYNGSVVNSSVGFNGSRQSLTLYNNSGSPITLNNIHMVTQAGNGVCRLYDITITTTTQSATELTFSGVPDGVNGFHLPFSPDTSLTHPNKYKTQSGSSTPPSDASSLTYNTGNYFGSNQGVTYDAGSVRKFWVQPGSADPTVKTSNDGTTWTTVFDGSVTWNNPIEVNCRYVYMSSSGNGFGPYFKQPAFAADTSGNDNHWLDRNIYETQTPATTSHRYWRAVIHDLVSHWPRMSKLYFYEADGTRRTHKNFTSDNCNDQGSIPTNGGVYSADYTNSYNFTNVGIYSTYNGGHRTGYADVYYSDDDIRWTYSFTSIVTNAAQCGERKGTLAQTDNLIDSPTDYEATSGNNGGNYATWNPLVSTNNLTNGNLSVVQTVNSTVASRYSTIGMSTGKWYWEIDVVGYANTVFGVRTPSGGSLETPYDSSGYGLGWRTAGGFFIGGSNTGSGSLSLAGGDLLGLAFDADAGTLAFYKNGSLAHTLTAASSYIGETWFAGSQDSVGGSSDHHVNFGQYPFKYPPGGTGGPAATFKSLCTQNLDNPLIEDPSDHFDIKLWTGNGGQQIVGGGTRWSDYVTGDIDSSFPAWRAFRNVTDQVGVRTQTANNATIVFQPPSPIEFSNSFKIWAARDSTSATFTVTHAGGTTDFSSSVVTGTTQTAVDLAQISGVTSPITKITIVSSGTNPRFSGIEVDGSMLIDSTADAYNFSPDLVWLKKRNAATSHQLTDTVRGATKFVRSNTTGIEVTDANTLSSFNSDSFKVGSDPATNGASDTFVSWGWDGGDLYTNSAYNQSQTWSASLSTNDTLQNPVNAFDGSTATRAQTANAGTGKTITFAPATDVSFATSLEVYCDQGNSTPTATWNGNTVNPGGGAWVTVYSGSGTINSSTPLVIDTETAGQYATLKGIRLDGKILVDPGVIPPGSANSSVYNDGEVWSTTGTLTVDLNGSTVSNMSGPLTKAFEGSLASSSMVYEGTAYTNGTKTYTYTFGTAQTNITSARVYLYQGNSAEGGATGFGNGTINKTQDGTYGWVDASSTIPSNGTVTAMTMTTTATSGVNSSRNGFIAIELNGKMLLDNGVTPVDNFPSIASTVRANPTAGFSIVKYTSTNTNNATVAHGLNADPEFILIKNIDSSEFWWAIHKYMNNDPWNDSTLRLNSSDGTTGVYGTFNNVAPTSSVVNLSNTTTPAPNKGTDDKIMYSFAPVKGYSAFGSYESSTPFVYTGFRPAYLAIKSTSGGRNWIVLDSARDQFNRTDRALLANDPSIEDDNSTYSVDFLSNGFKVLGSNGQITGDSRYIYLAFAENPFKYARAR